MGAALFVLAVFVLGYSIRKYRRGEWSFFGFGKRKDKEEKG